MKINGFLIAGSVATLLSVSACTPNQGINATTGGLVGAAVGSQMGQGRGNTAATLVGAAAGATIAANAPTAAQPTMCTYRNSQTGETRTAACPN